MFTTTVYLLIQMVLSYIEHKRCMVLRFDYFNNMHITFYTLIIFSSVNIDGIFIHEHKLTFKIPVRSVLYRLSRSESGSIDPSFKLGKNMAAVSLKSENRSSVLFLLTVNVSMRIVHCCLFCCMCIGVFQTMTYVSNRLCFQDFRNQFEPNCG